jgi:hypothetical protein
MLLIAFLLFLNYSIHSCLPEVCFSCFKNKIHVISKLYPKIIEIFKKKSIITKNSLNETLNKQIEERNKK